VKKANAVEKPLVEVLAEVVAEKQELPEPPAEITVELPVEAEKQQEAAE
jgi:hypothetical protein